MKKILSLLALSAALFSSCASKDNTPEKEYYTEQQKAAQNVLKGTFKEDFYGVVTTYTFTEQYDSFREAECYGFTGDSKSKFVVHGKCTLTYWNGDSYDLYYFMNEKADNIGFFSDKIHAKAYSLKIVSSTEFWLKGDGSASWNKYLK